MELGASNISDDDVNVIIAKPLKFQDGTVQSTASLGAVTARNVFIPGGARALNTVYVNSNTKPMFVSVSVYCNGFGVLASAFVGVGSPTIEIVKVGSPGGTVVVMSQLAFWVFPGESYKVITTGVLQFWAEWT